VILRAGFRAAAVGVLTLVPLLSCSSGSSAGGGESPCGWSVIGSRARTTADMPFENRNALLKSPDDPNRVKGPGRLTAIVKSDSLHHPQIYIEDEATGKRRHLLRGSKPKWSPDGTRIACEIWKSLQRPWNLCVVDVKTGKALEPEIGCLVDTYRWSPDGRSIAVGGTLYGKPVNVLCLVRLAAGTSQMLDTLPVFAAYEDLTWSPNSRALVVTRASAVNAEEETTAADLWLFDGEGRRCALTETPDLIEESPQWLDNASILYSFHSSKAGATRSTEQRVLLLKSATPK
jgi:Tol biopolymer transport system component